MPSRNIIKEYIKNGVYHIYNRGINKQNIFLDKQDYATFLFLLKTYLLPTTSGSHPEVKEYPSKRKKNFYGRVDLLCYCLMPNHFHLMIKQKKDKDISEFMKCIATNYSMYFNKKYERIGTVFQGVFKAVLVKDDSYLLHLSRYIHLNPNHISGSHPEVHPEVNNLWEYDYSSYAEYLGKRDTKWLSPNFVLDIFSNNSSISLIDCEYYQLFVEDVEQESEKILGDLILE